MNDVRIIPFLVSELRLPDAERAQLGLEWWPSYGHGRSVDRLRSFDPARVHFAHDPSIWERSAARPN